MKAIKIINTIAIATPFALFLIDLVVQGGFSIFALLSIMFTGFVQVILGLFLMIRFPQNIHYKSYIIAVVLYFLVGLMVVFSDSNNDGFIYIFYIIPPCLAVYLSILIYSRPNNELSQ